MREIVVAIFNYLPLKVHCWGGLGSQLLALNYYLILTKNFPKRKITLVLHDGGVTNRPSEIDFLNKKISLKTVRDFNETLVVNNASIDFESVRKTNFSLKFIVKYLLNLLRIVITDDLKVSNVKFWTLAVRSTYILNPLMRKDITSLSKVLEISVTERQQNAVGVHYRLGDLPNLKPESLISTKTISVVINDLCGSNSKINSVEVYSDSGSDGIFFNVPRSVQVIWYSVDTIQTIENLMTCDYFIGTSSKVSLWVAIFRWGHDIKGEVFLPKAMINHFINLTSYKAGDSKNFILKTY
jgi:hypothetical protein